MRPLFLSAFAFFWTFSTHGQHLSFSKTGWNQVREGQQVSFKITASDSIPVRHFFMEGGDDTGMSLDSVGNFIWKPSYDLVGRTDRPLEIPVLFAARLTDGRSIRQQVTFTLHHQNREPLIEDLPIFYVRQGVKNSYQISSDYVFDPDGDPITFRAIQNHLPEGMTLSASGLLTWTPSKNQFNGLKAGAFPLEFIAQDLPSKAETHGRIRIAQTQLDLPPELILVPGDSMYTIKEDELINIKIYATDPNGDDNVTSIGFVASDNRVPKNILSEVSPLHSDFSWNPGYKFVDEAEKSRLIDITFYALDKASNKIQKRVRVRVTDAENLDEKDKYTYQKYKASLIAAKGLLDQLDEKHSDLTKLYKQAKRGKKHRAIINASLGAATGLSPLVAPNQSKVVSGIGGTTVLTLGTLEATEVIGKSKTDILEQMKICVEVRNQLQVEGDNFARKYGLKSERRKKEFDSDREKLLPILNNQKLLLLELDASRRENKYDSKDIRKSFTDFSEEP
ncbi:MAG: Ig domain-containing protein [Bacteroidota bacterium]